MGNKPSVRVYQLNEELQATWRNSNFTMDELMLWYKDFKKRYPTGVITQVEFLQIYKEICPVEYNPGEFAAHVFRLYDLDHSGFLSFREFMCGMSMTSYQHPRKRIDWIFKLYDLDTDGFITPDEMTEILRAMFKMNPNPALDLTIKLQLGLNEISPEGITSKIFAKYDVDQDGRLTQEELMRCADDDPCLSKLLS